jgi:hypothetical protein
MGKGSLPVRHACRKLCFKPAMLLSCLTFVYAQDVPFNAQVNLRSTSVTEHDRALGTQTLQYFKQRTRHEMFVLCIHIGSPKSFTRKSSRRSFNAHAQADHQDMVRHSTSSHRARTGALCVVYTLKQPSKAFLKKFYREEFTPRWKTTPYLPHPGGVDPMVGQPDHTNILQP